MSWSLNDVPKMVLFIWLLCYNNISGHRHQIIYKTKGYVMLRDRIFSATKLTKSDLVFLNIQIVDVITQDIYTSDVAVKDGYFVGIGDYKGSGNQEIDGTGKFIIPGFIDAHAHIESTLGTPIEYSNASLPQQQETSPLCFGISICMMAA